MSYLTKISIYKSFVLMHLMATRYAFAEWLLCCRPLREAYNEYMSNLIVKIAKEHGDDSGDF